VLHEKEVSSLEVTSLADFCLGSWSLLCHRLWWEHRAAFKQHYPRPSSGGVRKAVFWAS